MGKGEIFNQIEFKKNQRKRELSFTRLILLNKIKVMLNYNNIDIEQG